MKQVSLIESLLIAIAFIQLIGCSSTRTLPAPSQSEPISINFSEKELSGWSDLPPGAHRIPDSQVIISGHQSNQLIGILFGPLGLAVQSSIDAGKAEGKTQSVNDILKIALTDEAKTIAQELTSSPEHSLAFTNQNTPDSASLDVRTAVILTFRNELEMQPYVLLQAELAEPNSKKVVWKSRYIASSNTTKPLTGDESWTSDSGEELNATLSQNLRKAIYVMMTDVASPFPRNEDQLIMLHGYYPYTPKMLQTVGYELFEDNTDIAYLPKLGDAIVFSGVNIMDKTAIKKRPAKPDDLRFKIVSPDEVISE